MKEFMGSVSVAVSPTNVLRHGLAKSAAMQFREGQLARLDFDKLVQSCRGRDF